MSHPMTDAPAQNVGSPEIGSPALWIGFSAFVVAALLLDFLVFHRKSHEVRTRQAVAWVGLWVALAMVLVLVVRLQYGSEPSLQFLAGYLLEYALSVDNLFVFLVIFTYFKVPAVAKDRALFLGILGSILLRGLFILVGSALIHRFHFILYVFGALLVFTGLKLLFTKGDEEMAIEHSPVIRLFRRFVPMVSAYHGDRFFIRDKHELRATPLLLVFAVLGLRALFFVVSTMMSRFHLLKFGLALILAFIGVKMLIADLYVFPFAGALGIDHPLKIPIGVALGVVAALLGLSVIGSLIFPAPEEPRPS